MWSSAPTPTARSSDKLRECSRSLETYRLARFQGRFNRSLRGRTLHELPLPQGKFYSRTDVCPLGAVGLLNKPTNYHPLLSLASDKAFVFFFFGRMLLKHPPVAVYTLLVTNCHLWTQAFDGVVRSSGRPPMEVYKALSRSARAGSARVRRGCRAGGAREAAAVVAVCLCPLNILAQRHHHQPGDSIAWRQQSQRRRQIHKDLTLTPC